MTNKTPSIFLVSKIKHKRLFFVFLFVYSEFLKTEVVTMKFQGLNAIALLEGFKGILALSVAIGVNALVGKDLHQLALDFMSEWGISPVGHYPKVILMMVDKISNNSLILVTSVALIYGVFRFVLAYGLWNQLLWIEWFAFITASLYIPFELYAIYQDINVFSLSALLINLVIAGYLFRVLKRGGNKSSIDNEC
jgi:uncharacterized membrane protein (DUF2068 family)